MTTLSVLKTSMLPAERGLPLWVAMWGDVFGRTTGRLDTDAYGQPTFEGQIEYAHLGRVRLCKIVASAHRVSRHSVSPVYADSRGFKVVMQLRGESSFEQGGRSVTLRPGQWTMYDAGKPYSVMNPQMTEQFVILLPRDAFSAIQAPADLYLAQPFCADTGIGRLACSMVRTAFEELSAQHLQSTHELGDTITRLFQQALLEYSTNLETRWVSRADQLRERIKEYIGQHLRDPSLSIEHIAAALDQTKRNMHRVFGPEGCTISVFIWTQRLESSCKALGNASLVHRSITDIAYGCGFSSSAHFSRMFKTTFGVSPRAYRNRAEAAAERYPRFGSDNHAAAP